MRDLGKMRKKKLTIAILALYFCLVSCSQQTLPKDPIPPHETFEIESKVVAENRKISVWTPPNYLLSDNTYPVLYMLDGGINEDFPHIANTISLLVERGDIAPLLVVGIENTERRRDLTGSSSVAADAEIAPVSDGAAIFREFVDTELFPQISKRYRVNNQRAIVGESVAGLFVVETLFLKPQMFDRYIAMDPSLWWNKNELVQQSSERLKGVMLEHTSTHNIKLWFTGSDAEDIFLYTEQLSKSFESNAPNNLEWTYLPQPKEHHHTIFRATKEQAFLWSLWKNSVQKD